MFFATTQTPTRRHVYAQAGRSLEQFLNDARSNAAGQAYAYEQDDTSFSLSLDVPGVAKDQLDISIEGAVVRIQSKEDAPRRYRAAYELPQEVDPAQSTAKLENGVLTLKLVKKVPLSNVSTLTIQ